MLTATPVDLPLGAYHDAPRRATQIDIEPGACLFLYTDGLVERRDQPVTAGIDRLLTALPNQSAEMMCASAMATLVNDRTVTDNVAILAVRRSPSP